MTKEAATASGQKMAIEMAVFLIFILLPKKKLIQPAKSLPCLGQ